MHIQRIPYEDEGRDWDDSIHQENARDHQQTKRTRGDDGTDSPSQPQK